MKRRDTPSSYARGLIEAAVANGRGRTQWATAVTIWPFLDVAAVNYGRYVMDVLPGTVHGRCLLDDVVVVMVQRLSQLSRGDLIAAGDVPLVTAVVGPMMESTTAMSSFTVNFADGRVWSADTGPIGDIYFAGGRPNESYTVATGRSKINPEAVWRSIRNHCFAKEQHGFIDRLLTKELAA